MQNQNHVDERFELLALIFRLAGREEYCNEVTDYQKMLGERFKDFINHPAINVATHLPVGYDAVAAFAMHMKREDGEFSLIKDTYSLLDGRWNETNTVEFLSWVNMFYKDTGFHAFFLEHMPVYEALSQRFDRQLYNRLNKGWFTAHGLRPDGFAPVVTPSESSGGYGISIKDGAGNILKVCPVLCEMEDYSNAMDFLVHEVCHSFSNPIAEVLYQENAEFRQKCDDAVDEKNMPYYNNGATMAGEYVTRANTILYMAENESADPLWLMLHEKAQGFPDIAYVYGLLTNSEPIPLPEDAIRYFLGADYKIGEEEHTAELGDRIVRWRFVDLLGHTLPVENFLVSQVGNAHGTQTGDVIYVADGRWVTVQVDVGPAQGWKTDHRAYSVLRVGYS